jgi:hypothetical protein
MGVTTNEMLQYFIEQNRVLTLDDLIKKYQSYGTLDHVYRTANALASTGKIEKVPKVSNAWIISEHTKNELLAKNDRSSKEYEKLHLEIEDLRTKVLDYPKFEARAKRSEMWTIISIFLAIAAILISLKKV